MTVASVLLLYAACVGTLGARVLARARWTARAPLLGMLTYLAAEWSALAAVGLAGFTVAVHVTALGGGLSALVGECVRRLRGFYATPGGAAAALSGLLLAATVVGRTLLTAAHHLRADGAEARRHAQTARLAGRTEPGLGAVVVDHTQPAAYSVAGRCPTVIVTSGAMAALSAEQLHAVLAHERAHLAGRHHALTVAARIGGRVLPFLPLLRDAQAQVARLAELHADDEAIRAADPGALATALVVLATPAETPAGTSSAGPVPAPPGSAAALAAAATDVVARIHRLLQPAAPLRRAPRNLLRAAAAALALAPALVALTPAVLALACGRPPAL